MGGSSSQADNPPPSEQATAKSRSVVVKIGGSTEADAAAIVQDIATLRREGVEVVVVHGGGNALSDWLKRTGKTSEFVKGLRVTDSETLEIAVMVFAGKINKEIVSRFKAAGVPAVGICGADGYLLEAEPETSPPGLGLVGRIVSVDTRLLDRLLKAGYTPVIAPIAADKDGVMYNVNADTVAGKVASALRSASLLFITDVCGVLDETGATIGTITPDSARLLRENGTIHGGMIPKVEAALAPLDHVAEVHIVDGSDEQVLLDRLRDGSGSGTRFIRG